MNHAIALATAYGPEVLGWLCVLSTAASAIVALTPTPPPDSRLRPIYGIVEKLGLVAGYAKDQGYITPTARQAALANGLVQIGARLVSKTTVADVPALPAAVVTAPPVSAPDLATIMAMMARAADAMQRVAALHDKLVPVTATAEAESPVAVATEILTETRATVPTSA